jgi:hypothetical protein
MVYVSRSTALYCFVVKCDIIFFLHYDSKKIPNDPVNYNMCGHFFCKPCVKSDKNTCPVCEIPSLASEITPDRIIANLIMGWRKICSTVGFKR